MGHEISTQLRLISEAEMRRRFYRALGRALIFAAVFLMAVPVIGSILQVIR